MNKQLYYVLWDTNEGLRYYKALKESEEDNKIKVKYEDNTEGKFFKKDLFTTKTNNLFNVLTSEQWAALTLLDMKEGSPNREQETLAANTQEGSGRKRNLKTRKLKGRGGKKRKRKTKKHRRRRTKRRVKKRGRKTRRKRGRGNTFKRAATATAVGALAMSNPTGAFKTKLPSRTAFNDAKFRLGRVCSTSPEGRKLKRKIYLQFHPDKYSVALKPQATQYFQELTEVFGNGSCNRKSTSSNRKPTSSNRNSRGRKNKPKSKPKPKRKSGESAKKARTRQKAENNTMRNIGAAIGITVTTAMTHLVRKASRSYRIGYIHTNGNEDYIYVDIDGNKKRIGTKDFILYVSGLLVNKDLRDHIEDNIDMGEWIIDQSDRGL